jgi:hypothetical protein
VHWGEHSGLQARFLSGSAPVTVLWGTGLHLQLQSLPTSRLPTPVRTGTVVATVTGSLGGTVVAVWQVVTTGTIGAPSWEWRLTH